MRLRLFFLLVLLYSGSVQSQELRIQPPSQTGLVPSLNLVVRDVPAFLKWAQLEGLEVAGVYRPANIVVLPASSEGLAEKVKNNEIVRQVFHSFLSPRPEALVPSQNLYLNAIALARTNYPFWAGKDAVISIREFPFYFSDVDLKNRILPSPNAFGDTTSHASFMATTAAGAGNSDPAGLGVATAARVISSSFGALLPEENYKSQGITIQNHAYGIEIENEYGVNAFAYDISALESPKVVQVFSSGNKGLEAATSGKYAQMPGFANLTGNFKMAKNIITVGAVDSFGLIVPFSSRGPAHDGRIKPELTAYGKDGSSGAAALVSGAAAVVQQALLERIDSFPDAVLVKTILLQTADDQGRPGPDFEYGFGNLNLQKALELVQKQHFAGGRVGGGQVVSFPIEVPANVRNLKITLVWTDLPASPGDVQALQNDLDLTVLSPPGAVLYPFTLHTAAVADSLNLPAFQAPDHLNNVEQTGVSQPEPGVYLVQIAGYSIGNDHQTFSLAYDWEPADSFEWVFPAGQTAVTAGKTAVVSWHTNLSDSAAVLAYKPVTGTEWLQFTDVAPLQAGAMRWQAPDTFAALQLRMTIGARQFISDTFLVADLLRMRVAFNCPDSVGLYWNQVAPGIGYRVFGLGDAYMEPLFDLQDTFVVLPTAIFPQNRFTVAALGEPSHVESLKSSAPDVRSQGLECYINRFTAELSDQITVELQMNIGTNYGLAEIGLEKWRNGTFQALTDAMPAAQLVYFWTDVEPSQGQNTYRVVLLGLQNEVVQQDTVSVFYAGTKNWVLFPNPVPSNEDVQLIYGGLDEVQIRVFDMLGRLILEYSPDDYLMTLPVRSLPPGVYLIAAHSTTTGKPLWSEPLLKNW